MTQQTNPLPDDLNGRRDGEPTSRLHTERASDQNCCLLYLFGELSAEERTVFESRLVASETLVSELLSLADSVVQVSSQTPVMAEPFEHPTSSRSRWIAVLCLAASLLIVVTGWKFLADSAWSVDDELLIARAWVNTSVHDAVGPMGVAAEPLNEPLEGDGESSGDEDVLSPWDEEPIPEWMLVAIAADSFEAPASSRDFQEGERSDG